MNGLRLIAMGLTMLAGCSATMLAGCFAVREETLSNSTWKNLIDAEKAALVTVVLRVRFIADEGGNKYGWDKVELIGVLKNESGYQFPKEFDLAHYSGEPGIPKGESTVYLERYNDTDPHLWKLLNGTGKDGVSHNLKLVK